MYFLKSPVSNNLKNDEIIMRISSGNHVLTQFFFPFGEFLLVIYWKNVRNVDKRGYFQFLTFIQGIALFNAKVVR